MRYSLRTLLLVLTLVAVSISWLLTSRRLHRAHAVIAEQRGEIRNLSHRLGMLTPEDLPFVQVRRVLRNGELSALGGEHQGIDLTWLIHLPPDKRWRLFWADYNIPKAGLPTQYAGCRDLPAQKLEWSWLRLSFPYLSSTGWSADFSYDGDQWSWPISTERSGWLEPGTPTADECAGPYNHHTHECFIEQFATDKPIVIYRERRQIILDQTRSTRIVEDDPEPCPGFMLWIEAAD